MTEFIAVMTIAILATISPGPDFVLVTKNSLVHGKTLGIYTAIGISLAVMVHVGYTLFGIGYIISQSILLFTVLKTVGSLYLIYIGIKMFLAKKGNITQDTNQNIKVNALSPKMAFKQGFICNVTNPKTTIFILSIFIQVVSPNTPILEQLFYGLAISGIHFIWFSLLATGFARVARNKAINSIKHYFEKAAGVILVLLGIKLLTSSTK
ncbi:LysE family transporter [Flavobacterium sp. LS1R49]|uniref:LysE family transporter n=1 Tax=Flavobacterium shii TaxID=2987687 RepID=A0A9X2ZD56_9FLAO|nr:LysE family transporter [Flavobacterium shii]MCV9927562.1 LysE family transporter [Flavobacterium shii]